MYKSEESINNLRLESAEDMNTIDILDKNKIKEKFSDQCKYELLVSEEILSTDFEIVISFMLTIYSFTVYFNFLEHAKNVRITQKDK